MAWFGHFLNQHGTGAVDSEGIRPETDTGNGDKLGLQLMENHGEGVSGSNFSQTQSPKREREREKDVKLVV